MSGQAYPAPVAARPNGRSTSDSVPTNGVGRRRWTRQVGLSWSCVSIRALLCAARDLFGPPRHIRVELGGGACHAPELPDQIVGYPTERLGTPITTHPALLTGESVDRLTSPRWIGVRLPELYARETVA